MTKKYEILSVAANIVVWPIELGENTDPLNLESNLNFYCNIVRFEKKEKILKEIRGDGVGMTLRDTC